MTHEHDICELLQKTCEKLYMLHIKSLRIDRTSYKLW